MVCPVSSYGDPRPFDWLMFSGRVGKHIAVTLMILSDDDDAGLIGVFTEVTAGSIATTNSRQVWSCR